MGLILVPHKGINTGGYKFDLYLSHVYTWYRILILVPCVTCGIGYLYLSHVLHVVYFSSLSHVVNYHFAQAEKKQNAHGKYERVTRQ